MMNSEFTQQYRHIAVEDNPLGKDVLLLTGFEGQEALSKPFNFKLDLLSKRTDISSRDIVGKKITFRINCSDSKIRYFNGYVSRLTASRLTFNDMRHYQVDVVPWLWFLTHTTDCRIFLDKTVPQIIEEVLADHGEIKDYELKEVKQNYIKREFCVQYRETDFNFLSRLMEEEGIFYWFRHEKNKHVMVMADYIGAYTNLSDNEVEFASGTGGALEHAHIYKWEHRHEFHAGKWAQTDYNFKTPSTKLLTQSETVSDLPDFKKYEIFNFPGQYLTREEGEQFTKVRMEEMEVAFDQVDAEGNYCSFAPGGKFTLTGHECKSEKGKSYLITAINHEAEDQTYIGNESSQQYYRNYFTCIPASNIYRPERKTPKSTIQGLQTAVVVGPSGEEIYTDEYGRVKVQFHWDRYGKYNEHSSCWIRVSQVHAGKGFGSIDIPRIGEEVIVEFLEGDPSRPIITGRIYNEDNKPPTDLPKSGMVSGMKSNTTPGGGGDNSILLDDTKKQEKITIHGQYDMNTTVEHDQTNTVNNKFTETIKSDASITIAEGKYSHDVKANTATYHVQGALTENYDATQDTTVKNNITITSSAGSIYLKAATKITLEVGASKITMDAAGKIAVDGVNIVINGIATVTTSGGVVHSEAKSEHQTTGAIVLSHGSATNTVSGGVVMLNP